MDVFEILSLPFMQRAFLAGIALGFVLPFLGVFVTLRKMSFFGDGIAHASLAGVAIGIVSGQSPFMVALIFAAFIGVLVYFLEKKTKVSSDALIGLLFTGSLALGLVVMSRKHGYQPELMSFMFGNILSVSTNDLLIICAFSVPILLALIIYFRKLTLLSLDKESAWLYGVNTDILDLFFHVLLSITIVLGVKLLGIILVSALLIIPPTIARLTAPSFISFVVTSVVLGQFFIVAGLFISYIFDLPSGASIILLGVMSFFLVASIKRISA
jgi:zinc transport system permease protein